MKVLIACEESQAVAIAFRKKGHTAYSCDIEPCSGGHPEWHLQGDVLYFIHHKDIQWDMMIAFPPCTFLTVTANRSFVNNPERWKSRLDAMIFVHKLMNSNIKKIALENPVGVISTHIRKPDQIIQPFEYGHKDSKKTCLWLKGLPLLKPTNIVEPEYIYDKTRGKRYSKTHFRNPGNSKLRSKTYQGIANAMADQWG